MQLPPLAEAGEGLSSDTLCSYIEEKLAQLAATATISKQQLFAQIQEVVKLLNQVATGRSNISTDSHHGGDGDDTGEPLLIPPKKLGEYEGQIERLLLSLVTQTPCEPLFTALVQLHRELQVMVDDGFFSEDRLKMSEELLVSVERELAGEGQTESLEASIIRMFVTSCRGQLAAIHKELSNIDPALQPIYHRLVAIKRELDALGKRNPMSIAHSVTTLQDELLEIDSVRIDGKYISKDGTLVTGQAIVIQALEQCFDDAHELLVAREPISGGNPLRGIYEDLIGIRARLNEVIVMGPALYMKPRELIMYQQKLGEIDNMRVDGKFLDAGGKVPEGQAVLHFLLHKCYRMVYKIQLASGPVDESLMPIYNQLNGILKCLKELKKWNVKLSSSELMPYQIRLGKIDGLRVKDVFYNAKDSSGEIPEGQGVLHEMLSKCYALLDELAEEDEE